MEEDITDNSTNYGRPENLLKLRLYKLEAHTELKRTFTTMKTVMGMQIIYLNYVYND